MSNKFRTFFIRAFVYVLTTFEALYPFRTASEYHQRYFALRADIIALREEIEQLREEIEQKKQELRLLTNEWVDLGERLYGKTLRG